MTTRPISLRVFVIIIVLFALLTLAEITPMAAQSQASAQVTDFSNTSLFQADPFDSSTGAQVDAEIAKMFGTSYHSLAQIQPFTVIATDPPDNGQIIAPDGTVSATFSRDINYATINARNFAVRGKQTGAYPGSYTFNSSQSVQFDATNDFMPGEEIIVNLSDGFKAADGTALTPYAWEFRADVTPSSGLFFDSGTNLGSGFSQGITLGDLDDDGDLDAFIGNINDQPNTVWLNDGLGNFSDTGQRLGGSYSAEVVLGDVDSDGDLDAFVANFWSQPKSMAAETMVSW